MTSAHLLAYAVVAGFMLIGFMVGYVVGKRRANRKAIKAFDQALSSRLGRARDAIVPETPATPGGQKARE